MKKFEKGFSIVEVLIIIVVIGLVGAAGWLVYDRQSTKENTENSQSSIVQNVKATDSASNFSFEYPENWQIEPYVWDSGWKADQIEPDWTKETQPITLYPSENKDVLVTIYSSLYDIYYASYSDLTAKVKEDYFAKILFEGQRDDGHKALFARVDYLGPPDAKVESFTDHRYYFDNGLQYLLVDFREKYHHDWYPENDIDFSQFTEDFKHIANSVKFLK